MLGADLLNVAIFGEHTRCGAVLPVTGLLTFAACRRAETRQALAAPLALTTGIATVTTAFELGASSIPFLAVVLGGCAAGGYLIGRRDLVVGRLDEQNRALEAQRDQTARLAVDAERSRIGGTLSAGVEEHVAAVLGHAQTARTAPAPERAAAAFGAIEHEGRAGLSQMRAVVDELHPASLTPTPTLDELDGLLAARRECATVGFAGERRPLAPGVELAACRIVELLLGVVDPGDAGLSVRVRYGGGDLEVEMTAPATGATADPGLLAAARARAAAVGGSVELRPEGRRTRAQVLLPAGAGA